MPTHKDLAEARNKGTATSSGAFTAETLIAGRYGLGCRLGSGNFGTAYVVQDHKTGEKKVLKRINIGEVQPNETVEAVKEATLLAQLDHPAIVKYHDSFMDVEHFCIITEYCEGGDLDYMLKKLKSTNKILDESLIMDWFIQLTNAVHYIHDRKVLHRDLKTRNIFLKDKKIKLGDFGISRILVATSDFATTFTGTPYYMSPEVLKHEGYNSKSDIWSLGAVLYELCTCEHAYQGQNIMAIMYKIVEGHPPRLPNHFTPSMRYLHSRMMDKSPARRPSAIEILQDPCVKRHLESHKLSLSLVPKESNPSEEAKAIAQALSNQVPSKGHKDQNKDISGVNRSPLELPVNKKLKSRDKVPPWVKEHPDVFVGGNISMTAFDTCEMKEEVDKLDESLSLMEVAPGQSSEIRQKDMNSMTESYQPKRYSQQLDTLKSSSSSDEVKYTSTKVPGTDREKVQQSHDGFSLFTPIASERRMLQLQNDALRIFGPDVFQSVYRYLKVARADGGVADEAKVLMGLRSITQNIKDCFLVDQLVFLEKQRENSL
ncbi:PREDICTED: serine/threonine-protein kinase Nek11-like [Amphimedon queenslandica]|uniref:non-specific serine/threonine protein kinase n=1 Tax=Amphimedon queenslandica TaxID=400682 RepID=A0A1X7VB11_AMPQE|nr:PREDICTED: serine/threonine-protein kinase Nek11-like [Amphimedon queenslandica]|eukprot:XP_019849874.1 PREDICTED: serine/threonine-protein kinase Nek11-like [Amphimedon queenslandica]